MVGAGPSMRRRAGPFSPRHHRWWYHDDMLKVGVEAPDFEAVRDDGETFHLSDWRGSKKVVLFFYLKDFTLG